MKKLMMIALLSGAASLQSGAQETKIKVKDADVPQTVRNVLQTKFPTAKDIDWKMKDGNYKVSFEIGDLDHMAELTGTGEWISTGMEIEASVLPDVLVAAIRKNYPGTEIDDIIRIERTDGELQYLIELDGKPDRKVLFDAQGNVLREKLDD